ncbi:MAG: ABC transporter ATP-binding protein [Kiritimatiellae bacterium]|nr:ABC transporter ATP-binding protein [Kiritimatiellia bacterium]MBR4946678.1 ABC transporter ATP-binding protein [Kiritimatiellia bacterium]MBR5587367.1 ABC transporter ATP-binding protein [Kiritimatiellia bacterium]
MSEQPLSLEEAAARIKVKAPIAPIVQPQAETPILEVNDLNTWFPIKKGIFARTAGYVKAVNGVTFSMKAGETLGVVGESGCGKSTLSRTILRLEKAHSGSVRFMGKDVFAMKGPELQQYRRDMQVVFQDPHATLNPRHSILDILTEGLLVHGMIKPNEAQDKAAELLMDVGLQPDAMHRYPHAFSGGQRQRICIARAIALKPKMIICDEAVSALDLSIRAQVLNLLMELKDKYSLAYLFITHDIGVVEHIADNIIVMYKGEIVERGPATDVLLNPQEAYTQRLISAVPRIG